MPPVAKVKKEMVLNEGLSIIRRQGIRNLNVRNIAKGLNCSTQPIMYLFKNMDTLKEELYVYANEYHTEYLMQDVGEEPLLSIGINYIRFACEEKNLFKFLFESNKFENKSFLNVIDSNENELEFIFDIISSSADISKKEAKELFESIFISAHGMASLIANNSMRFDGLYCKKLLEISYIGTLNKIKGEI